MAEGDVRQYFVRNDQGTLWGPLELPTIELLIDNGAIQGRLQVSEDGLNFAWPGRFPHLRDAFPREITGPTVWKAEDYRENPEKWTHKFTEEQIEELSNAVFHCFFAFLPYSFSSL